MRCLHHPFVLVSWFRGFVRRRPSIVFVVVFIEVGFWCGGARVSSSSSGLLLLFRQVSRDRDGLDDGFLRPRRRRCLHPRLRVRFGRKALRRHRSRIEKERKKKKRFGVVRTDGSFAIRVAFAEGRHHNTRKGEKEGEKNVSRYTLCDAPGYARTCALHSSQVSYTPTVRPRATA